MPLPDPSIEAVTTASLSLALDVASLRHAAHVSNITQKNVADYRRATLDTQALEAVRTELSRTGRVDAGTLAAVRLQLRPASADVTGGNGIKLDQEMAELNANTLRYQTLVNALNLHMGLLDLAVSEGKR